MITEKAYSELLDSAQPGFLDLGKLLPAECPDCQRSWSDINSSYIVKSHDALALMRAVPPGESTGALHICVDCPKCGGTWPKHIEYIGKLVTP